MKRKPWVEAAERTCWATSGEGEEISMTGIVDWDMINCGDAVIG